MILSICSFMLQLHLLKGLNGVSIQQIFVVYNSSNQNIIFEIFCSQFGAPAVAKMFNKKVKKNLSLFSHSKFPGKKRD